MPTTHAVTPHQHLLMLGGHVLLHHYAYPASETPDVDVPTTWRQLYEACYDLHQCVELLQDDDILTYKGIEFARVESYHLHARGPMATPDAPLP